MDFWFTRGLSFLPIFVIVWTYLTFTISYIISVSRGDVDPGFPYISDTGARRPESSIFGQMLNITAGFALACLYVRYKQVESFLIKLSDHDVRKVYRVNKISWYFGIAISLGMSLVANFQETSVLGVHLFGALLTFGGGTVYEFMQTYITYKMHPEVNGLVVAHVRLGISILSVVFITTTFIASSIAQVPVKFHWAPEDHGYAAHLASTIAEWLLAATFLSYFYTFIRDFQVITMDVEPNNRCDNLHHSINGAIPVQSHQEERTPLIA
uniref:DNA damage-regulated autophagy modulator protein 2-like n=1 Tax=Styela clava TaxID=7725 RepID=UPI00193A65EE|nr:DNA damage-regulated autophagy modulator protein 2-like [Styela clava]